MSFMPSGSKQYRVILSWHGNDPSQTTGSSWAQVYYSDPPYTTWSPSNAANQNINYGSNADNNKRVTFTLCRPAASQVLLVFEHLDSDASGNLQGVDTAAQISNDNGQTFGAPVDITPGDGNYYFFPNGCVDQQENAWVFYYWRTPSGTTNRDLCADYYSGSWHGKINVLDTQAGGQYANNMFPAGESTNEGANSNRVYCAFTSGQSQDVNRKMYVVYTDDKGATFQGISGSPGYQTPTIGPFGTDVSQAGYITRPVLSMSKALSGTKNRVMITYLENKGSAASYNPWGLVSSPSVQIVFTDDGFATTGQYVVTQDGYSRSHPISWVEKDTTYAVWAASSSAGNMDIWMAIYQVSGQAQVDYYERTTFTQGWMLISVPLQPSDKKLTSVLSTLNGKYTKVQWYDPNDAKDHWKTYEVGKNTSAGYMIDLLNLDNKVGFWIYISDPTNARLNLTGKYPTSQTAVTLKPGWNLVGFPSKTPATVGSFSFPSGFIVMGFNGTAQYRLKTLTGSDTMTQGSGFWIFNSQTSDYAWNVNP